MRTGKLHKTDQIGLHSHTIGAAVIWAPLTITRESAGLLDRAFCNWHAHCCLLRGILFSLSTTPRVLTSATCQVQDFARQILIAATRAALAPRLVVMVNKHCFLRVICIRYLSLVSAYNSECGGGHGIKTHPVSWSFSLAMFCLHQLILRRQCLGACSSEALKRHEDYYKEFRGIWNVSIVDLPGWFPYLTVNVSRQLR